MKNIIAPSICLIGCGNMGAAMLKGWLQAKHNKNKITIIDPRLKKQYKTLGVRHYKTAHQYKGKKPDFVILAVKPQIMKQTLSEISFLLNEKNVLLSIVAGKKIAHIEKLLGNKKIRIIRTMPNTPAQVNCAISVCVDNGKINARQKTQAKKLLNAIGEVEWLAQEKMMDAITATSGSGPAYVFYLAETLAKAGEKAGLPKALALKLALYTIKGAAELMVKSKTPPAILRQNVTSPNGTTEHGLQVLMHQKTGLAKLMEKTVAAATNRSKQLAKENGK